MTSRSLWGAVVVALSVAGCPGPEVVPPTLDGGGIDGSALDGAPTDVLTSMDVLGTDAARCTAATECDDGVYCNGPEACTAGACVSGTAPCPAASCDESLDACPCATPDADGDGERSVACGGTDCDDADPNRAPGRTEICDASDRDEDCDPTTYGIRDADGDGEPDAACCNDDGAGGMRCGTDCDDARASVSPRLVEACDSLDNDCDGATDEGVLGTYYADADMDLHGSADSAAEVRMACFAPTGFVPTADDCDDGNAAAHPGTPEVCDSADPPVDENCDGLANPPADCDCTAGEMRACQALGVCATGTQICVGGTWGACPIMPSMELVGDGLDSDCNGGEICFVDVDGDGARTSATVASVDEDCDDPGEAYDTDPAGDCDDLDPLRFPGATETIANGIDENCDGGEVCYVDGDNDGFRTTGTVASANSNCSDLGEALESEPTGDCNDMDPSVRPSATEVTGNEIDDDCDGAESCWANRDGDGFRTTMTVASSDTDCRDGTEAPTSLPAGDCDDDLATVFPGAAETIGDEVDQNCDLGETCYADADRDTYRGTGTIASTNATCTDPGEARASDPTGDCDDSNPSVSPSETEVPGNEIDEDCDGGEVCFENRDGDGFRTTETRVSADPDCRDAMEAPSGTPAGDCDDGRASVYPSAPEVTGDGIDQDCNNGEICVADADSDGYSGTGTTTSSDTDCADAGEALSSGPTGDCNDANAAIYPGATELPGDGVDQNCDTDELCYLDDDDDGFRAASATLASSDADCTDAREASATDPTGDCNDSSAAIRPGAAEITGDGVDQNCDGNETCWADLDDDGYRTPSPLASMDGDCSDPTEAVTSDPSGDCNDGSDTIRPGVAEVPGDQLDQNCDGAELCYVDADGDGYRVGAATVVSPDLACSAAGEALATDPPGDCNDSAVGVNPGRSEICDGGMPPVDENCDGLANPPSDCACSAGMMRACPLPGICGTGTQTCVGGAWSACPIMPSMELVGDGLDSDCNGSEICYADGDDDGVRTVATVASSDDDCTDAGEARDTEPAGDCDDGDALRYPGATEAIGDGVDANCDGGEICYADGDNDGYRVSGTVTSSNASCADLGEALASEPSGDCNDMVATIHPGAVEVTGNELDDDCSGGEICWADLDNDDYRTTSTVMSSDSDCTDSTEAATGIPAGDCNDMMAAINPGASEMVGDGVDANCDGGEVCVVDSDNDGYSGTGTTVSSDVDCTDPGENLTSSPTGDCNDAVAAIRPGATELAGDGVDQNCDAMELCFVDADNDTFRPGAGTSTTPSTDTDCTDPGEAESTDGTDDCNDASMAIRPGVAEMTGDGVDQNCDGNETCWADVDDDGYRTGATIASGDTDCNDADEALTSEPTNDCDDTDMAVRPNATEIAGDQVDQNCDMAELCFFDDDDDGYRPGTGTATIVSTDLDCADADEALSTDLTNDCNDAAAAIRPGVAELPGDEIDQNCDGQELCYADGDQDVYRTSATVVSANLTCTTGAGEARTSTPSNDCVDTDASIHPNATELCDGIDQDCDTAPRNTCPSGTETLGTPAYSGYYGASSGTAWGPDVCGSGRVLVGLDIWYTPIDIVAPIETGINGIRAVCTPVQIFETMAMPQYQYELRYFGSTLYNGVMRGTATDVMAQLRCPSDRFVRGINGRQDTSALGLQALGLECGTIRWGGGSHMGAPPWTGVMTGTSSVAALGAPGGTSFTYVCPPAMGNFLGTAIQGRFAADGDAAALSLGCAAVGYVPQ